LEKDIDYISEVADIVFAPSQEEIFPTVPTEKFHFGILVSVMEGAYRPILFNGVAFIVKRLFDWIIPDKPISAKKIINNS
jgi:pantoate--beta-alanine ligase